jgi:hypothetical protein
MLTNNDFIRMAKEAGFDVDNDNIVWCDFGTYDDELIKFAALVATHIEEQIGIKMLFDMVQAVEDEREACAKLADECVDIEKLGDVIRARGDALTRLNKAAEDNGEEL